MKLYFKYGSSTRTLAVPDQYKVKVIEPIVIKTETITANKIKEAIQNPLKTTHLSAHKSVKSVAIAINDKTRPVRYDILLPPLLECLHKELKPGFQVTFYISSGTHTPMSIKECAAIIPKDIYEKYPILVHDCDDVENQLFLGTTSRGTPVFINTQFYQSDLKIVVGNIEPHHFMGFSGGVKTAAIGLVSRKTINHNHQMLLTEKDTVIGQYEQNPMRMDVEEIGEMVGVDYALNAIQSPEKTLIDVYFGYPKDVMLAAIDVVRTNCQVAVREQFDLTIASAGGYPKDINLYQAQKAITNAAKFTKDGGNLILFAECSEGIGNSRLVAFMRGITSTDGVREKLRNEGFQVGPHKAFLIARDIDHINIHLISGMDAELVRLLFLNPVTQEPEAFIETLLNNLSYSAKIGFIPNAVITIPV